jgi:hypothetical protein
MEASFKPDLLLFTKFKTQHMLNSLWADAYNGIQRFVSKLTSKNRGVASTPNICAFITISRTHQRHRWSIHHSNQNIFVCLSTIRRRYDCCGGSNKNFNRQSISCIACDGILSFTCWKPITSHFSDNIGEQIAR